MKKTDLALGVVIGILAALIGSYLFIVTFLDTDISQGIALIKANGQLGKVITLGAVLNLIIFFTLLHFKKELMARGVVLATILLAILTIFI